jgi:hypothetical protein
MALLTPIINREQPEKSDRNTTGKGYRCGLATGAFEGEVRYSKRRFAVPVTLEIWSGSTRSGANL